MFSAFLYYWLEVRDTWEADNFSRIVDLCEEVDTSIVQSKDSDALEAYLNLNSLIGEHQIENGRLRMKVQGVRESMIPVMSRLEVDRRQRMAEEAARVESERIRRESHSASLQRSRGRDAQIERYMQSRWRYYESRDGIHDPGRHDPLVLRDAARQFGISEDDALRAFRRAPDSFYGRQGTVESERPHRQEPWVNPFADFAEQ